MFKAAAASSQANGTNDAAGVDLGSSPSWRCVRARRDGRGFEREDEGEERSAWSSNARGVKTRAVEGWIGIIFIHRVRASRRAR